MADPLVGPSTRAYALERSATERRRLVLQERVVGTITARFLEDAGVRPGMRVLAVGSGAGDVALLVARSVGPSGSVVGVDVDVESVETARQRGAEAGLTNVEFVAADVAATDVGSDFDAAVGRLVLMHLPDPVSVLHRLVSALRPGGLLAFQEVQLESRWLSFPPVGDVARGAAAPGTSPARRPTGELPYGTGAAIHLCRRWAGGS
jgi:2-polyprenyl-3-methyl-5-hydroxy-6-metoxy-1,4-benzoquinol methylase